MPGQYHSSGVKVHLICLAGYMAFCKHAEFCFARLVLLTSFKYLKILCDLFMANKYELKCHLYIFVTCPIKVFHPFGLMVAVNDVVPTVSRLRCSGL